MKPKIREKQFGPLVIGLSLIIAIILIALACSSPPTVNTAPCCEEEVCEEEETLPPLSPFDLISEE